MERPQPARALALAAPLGWEAGALAWPALCALAAVAAVVPLWAGRFLPFQDAPQHLAAVRVLADYGNPVFAFRRWFEIDLARSQYLGFYLPAALLARVAGPEAACRIVLSLIALALPAASWTFLRSFDRDPRLAVLAPALFHTAPLYLGFFNFVESVPATILVIALLERELRAPRRGTAVALAVAAAALLYLHPSALALALGAGALLAVTSGAGWRRAARSLAPLVPAVALLAAWMATSLFAQSPDAVGHAAASWQPLRDRVLDLLRFGNVLAGHADEAFVAALLLCWLAAALVPGRTRDARWWRLPLLAACLGFASLAVPETVGAAGSLHLRAIPLLAFVFLSAPALAPGRVTSALLAAAVALQLAYDARLAAVYRAFDAEAEAPQLEQVLRAAEPGRRLLSLVADRQSHQVQFQAYQHFGMYYQVERGGRARRNFAELPWTPVRFRAGTPAVPLPPGWEEHPDWFDPAREGAEAEYLLVRGPAPDPGGPFVVKARAGRWTLYEARGH
ncbi:MAG TPA: hypothetical protein VF973_03565 [Myxococcales bacterium]